MGRLNWRACHDRGLPRGRSPGGLGLGRRLGEHLELSVVRVAEDEYRSTRYGVRRRDRGMDDRGVCQPRRPGVEFSAAADRECQVVPGGVRFAECVLAAVPALCEPWRACRPSWRRNTLRRAPSGAVYSLARWKPSTSLYQAALVSTLRTVSPKWCTPLIMPCLPLTDRSSHPEGPRHLQRAQSRPATTRTAASGSRIRCRTSCLLGRRLVTMSP